MPVVLRAAGFTLFFFSNEGDPREPVHIHARRSGGLAKFWIGPVQLAKSRGFDARSLAEAERLVVLHETLILEVWREHFGDDGAV
jgi:Domain of unknown function (DUF4160)